MTFGIFRTNARPGWNDKCIFAIVHRICAALLLTVRFAFAWADGGLSILVLKGEGSANNISTRSPRDLAIKVSCETGPVPGAIVTFTAPHDGPGGEFVDGTRLVTVSTDAQGVAEAKGFRPNTTVGKFEIRVTTSWNNARAQATITEFNMEVARGAVNAPTAKQPAATKSHGHGKTIAILLLVAGAAAGGGIAAMSGHGSSAPAIVSTRPATIGITPGPAFVGPPH